MDNEKDDLVEAIRLIDAIRQIHNCFRKEKNDLIKEVENFYRIVNVKTGKEGE